MDRLSPDDIAFFDALGTDIYFFRVAVYFNAHLL